MNEIDLNLLAVLKLSTELTLGKTPVNREASLFEAAAQSINLIKNNNHHTEKSLRMLCYSFFLKNKEQVNRWNRAENCVDKNENYAFIQYTQNELKKYFEGNEPVCSSIYVEGKIICAAFNLDAVHVILLTDYMKTTTPIIKHAIINQEKIMFLDEFNISVSYVEKIPVFIWDKNNQYFIPIIKQTHSLEYPAPELGIIKETSKLRLNLISVFLQLPCYALCRDTNGNTLWGNQMMAKAAGLNSYKQLEGLNDCNAPWSEYSDVYVKHDCDAYAGIEYKQLEPFYSMDGYQVHLAHKAPLIDDNKKTIAVIGIGVKIKNKDLITLVYSLNKMFPSELNKSLVISDENYLNRKFGNFKLTEREVECLFYLLRGKSTKITASILGLSPRTVECYIENIKHKIGCHNKYEIIDKSISLGLMNLIPEKIINNFEAKKF